MPKNIHLMKLVRGVTSRLAAEPLSAEHLALLHGADVALNELMLREAPGFYVEHIRTGRELLAEATDLVPNERPGAPSSFEAIENWRADALEAEIDRLTRCLTTVMRVLTVLSPYPGALIERITQWEIGLYHHRHEDAGTPKRAAARPEFTKEAFEAYVRVRFPEWPNFRVVRFHPLYGGFSKQTILVDGCDDRNGRQALVIRAEQEKTLLTFDGSDVTKEYPALKFLFAADIPVAEPVWLEADAAALGVRFMVSRKADGVNYGNPAGATKSISREQIEDIIHVMARVHAIKVDADDPLIDESHLGRWARAQPLAENTRVFIKRFLTDAVARMGIEPTPMLTRIHHWLLNNLPVGGGEAVITHLDYALNNLLLDEHRVTAVLDWETSRVGDPAEEVVWTYSNLAAHITREEFLSIYRRFGGRELDGYRLAYFDVMSAFKVIIVCLCSFSFLESADNADITLCSSAYRYLYRACGHVNDLIARAEALAR